MRIITRKVENQPLTIIVEYPELDCATLKILGRIEHLDTSFVGRSEEQSARISVSEIYYFETVDRKVFLYTRDEIYRFDGSMAQIEEVLEHTELVRVSRTCIMNTEHLKEIRQIKNSHLEAILDNEEKIIVSRKYLPDIKNLFRNRH